MNILLFSILLLSSFLAPDMAAARDRIRVVGSSTVYPFVTLAAEEFGNTGSHPTPVVESTGTGGGFKLFCAGVGDSHPDIASASRSIKASERELCKKNGVNDITEIKIGYDGIVLANAKGGKSFDLTKEQLFLALAKLVPQSGELVNNFHETWDQISPALPKQKIEVYGPPPTSGTRDAFADLVMEEGCKRFPEFKKAYQDEESLRKQCHLMREDGRFIEAGENDNLVVQKLVANRNALGIFGFGSLDQNLDKVQPSTIEGVSPEFDKISDGSYTVSRSLFVYLKNGHLAKIPGLKDFILELTGKNAMGKDGYMAERGLIPLKEVELEKIRGAVSKL